MPNKILTIGSVAYDILFSMPGDIRDEILIKKGKVEKVSMMFTATSRQKYYGGGAGNISYGLSLLNAPSLLFSVTGTDIKHDYKQHLKKLGVNLRIVEKKNTYTGTWFGISDERFQQIGIWEPGAFGDYIDTTSLFETLSEKDFQQIQIAIFAPATAISTRNHMVELRNKTSGQATIIFDPGQSLSIFYKPNILRECLTHTNIAIGNETEINQLKKLFKLDLNDIFKLGVETVIETLGEKGVLLHTKAKTIEIPPYKPLRVVEATGAGDAFRAGFTFGLLNNYSLEASCKIGAFMGAKNVEEMGGQLYSFTKSELENVLKGL